MKIMIKCKEVISMKVIQLETKIGLPTIQIEKEGKKFLIHSKYDPVKEAIQIIEKNKEKIEQHQHVLFYGVGLGYHVRTFIEQYPEKLVSTYEPIEEIAKVCAVSTGQTMLNKSQIRYSFIEEEAKDMEKHLYTISNHLTQQILLIILPSYERFFKDKTLQFLEKFKEIVQVTNQNIVTYSAFSKTWMINSLMNLSSTFKNPNFLLEYSDIFRNQPVILVAAGPSLNEEIENLREIKKDGTAYIFAVGSANKALIAQGIYPDAIFTYDPQAHNHTVFQSILDEKITSIPIIYGTTVGYETIQRYPGPKCYFVTSQDTVTQQFHSTQLPVVDDAYSIAIVTLELLYQLQVKSITLVGQNFAFKNELYYSMEIQRYNKEERKISDARVQTRDLEDSYYVPDVYGNDVLTNKTFDNMRKLMEQYILRNPQIQVYNTTVGGAQIKGTSFSLLKKLMEVNFTHRIVSDHWIERGKNSLITKDTIGEVRKLQKEAQTYLKQDMALFKHFHEIQKSISQLNESQVKYRFEKTDQLVRQITSNKLYNMVIRPVLRNAFDQLRIEVELLNKLPQSKDKLTVVVNLFTTYFNECRTVYREIVPSIQSYIWPEIACLADKKEYTATIGIFDYKGKWTKETVVKQQMPEKLSEVKQKEWQEQKLLVNRTIISSLGMRTKSNQDSVRFRFRGTSFSLYGSNHSKGILKLSINIDNKITNLTIKESINEEIFGSSLRTLFFRTDELKNEMHSVCITITSGNPDFLFQAIEIDRAGRAYHIQEVDTFEKMKVGNKIRCHVAAVENAVAYMENIGEETAHLINKRLVENSGDVYLTKIYEGDQGVNSKFVCDQSIGAIQAEFIQDGIKKVITFNIVPIMNTNETEVCKVSCSSYYINDNHHFDAFKAFNKKLKGLENAWATEKGTSKGWIAFEFCKPIKLNTYTMVNQEQHFNYDTLKRMPKSWIIKGWNGTEWITLDERVDINDWKDSEKKHFSFRNVIGYQKYRINISQNNGDPNYLALGEMEFN